VGVVYGVAWSWPHNAQWSPYDAHGADVEWTKVLLPNLSGNARGSKRYACDRCAHDVKEMREHPPVCGKVVR
jgi:hypothetical protein